MISKWTDHLRDQEEKERFKAEVLASRRVFERLEQMLTEEEANLGEKEISVKAFEVPNWPYLQAYQNGYRKSLSLVRKIINLRPTEQGN